MQELPFWRYAIVMNGAVVWDRAEGRAIRRAELSPRLAVRVMARLEDFPGTLDCYMEDNCGWMEARYYAALDDWILDPVSRRIIREMRRPMEDLRGYVGRRGRPVQKIQSYFRDEATQRAVLAALAEEFPELSVACSLPGNVELTHRDATKGGGHDRPVRVPGHPPGAGGGLRGRAQRLLHAGGGGAGGGHGERRAGGQGGGAAGDGHQPGGRRGPDAAPAAGGGGMTEAYYFRQLDKAGQAAYHAMKTGLAALRPASPGTPAGGAGAGRRAGPPAAGLPGAVLRHRLLLPGAPGRRHGGLLPQYLFDKGKIQTHQKALAARLDRLCRPAMGLNEGEKERYVHDFICRNVRYDKLKKPYSHEILGPLGQGWGCARASPRRSSACATGWGCGASWPWRRTTRTGGSSTAMPGTWCAWGDAYYHLDATFDNSLGSAELVRYDYFNLDDRRLFRDHEALVYPVPACADGGRFYYREAKLSFTRPEEVAGRAAQAVRKGSLWCSTGGAAL